MRIWIPSRSLIFAGLRGHKPRRYSAVANDVERVNIPVGSSGDTTIDLHNIAKLSSEKSLLVYLPPFSTAFTNTPAQLPRFIRGQPTAVINYRWDGFSPFQTRKTTAPASTDESDEGDLSPILSWPAPIHDTSMAYNWIVRNLGPSDYTRQNIYLYGSYLGASLAMSLALTETHPHERMAVRGCIAFNGIYNWTRFLPDHPVNNPPKPGSNLERIPFRPNDPQFQKLKHHAKALFVSPSGLFDPFASATLFFYTPGLLVPPNFTISALSPEASPLANLSLPDPGTGKPRLVLKHPYRSQLVFPPRTSTLKIPETLLLHTRPPPLPPSSLRRRQSQEKKGEEEEEEEGQDSFQAQAGELATFMRSSIDKVELGERFQWDNDRDSWNDEATRRVQVHNIGSSIGNYSLNSKGEELAATWLEDHIS